MITIVSGLPRSGTSLVMQMLKAGGYPIYWNKEPNCDAQNPRGYYEWENSKQLWQGELCDQLFAGVDGRIVKIFPQLFPCLSPLFDYQFIYIDRPIIEIAASQRAMLSELKRDPNEVKEPFLHKLRFHAMIYLAYFRHLVISHEALYTRRAELLIENFLGDGSERLPLRALKMANVIDPTMRHHTQGEM